jgi:nitrogenase-stabilizing/protective protein
MDNLMRRMEKLSSIEDFMEFFAINYAVSVVNVSRLHILKRFYLYLREQPGEELKTEMESFLHCRRLLALAYDDFCRETPRQARVFKVFQRNAPQPVSLESLRIKLPARSPRSLEGQEQ